MALKTANRIRAADKTNRNADCRGLPACRYQTSALNGQQYKCSRNEMEGSCERSSNYVTYIIAKSCKRCTLHVVVEGNPAALQEAIYNMVDFICIGPLQKAMFHKRRQIF